MKKVIFFVNDLNSGGIENYLLRFLNHYDGKICPTVFCKGNAFGDLENDYRKIKDINLIKLEVGYFDLRAFLKLFQFLKKGNYETAVDFTGNFGALPLLMAKYANVQKRIVFYRGATNHFKETFFKKAYNNTLNLLILKNATCILSNSKAALKFFFTNQNDPRFEVIYNGIDSDKFLNNQENLRNELNIPTDAFVIGHIGRFAREKNHNTVFEVAKLLCSKYKDVYFILCGKGVDEVFSQRVQMLKLEKQIIILGYRKDVVKVLNSINAFYFPSFSEGQPNALIEALIAGLPFVASNIDPILETIPESHYEYLIDPCDVNNAVELFAKFYNQKNEKNQHNIKEWAVANYDPAVLFKKFYDKL